MIDLTAVVSIVGCLSCIGLISFTKVRESALETKMTNDVSVLNSAVKAFITRGGEFSGSESVESVLSALKSVATNNRIPGFSGSLIDDRLVWKMQTPDEAKSDKPRVTWSNSAQRFEIVYQGRGGIGKFELADSGSGSASSSPNAGTAQQDSSPFLFAEKDGWIWDYDAEAETSPKPSVEPTKVALAGGSSEPEFDGSNWIPVSLIDESAEQQGNSLAEPVFSVPPGTYQEDDFDLAVTISNPNPAGSSEIVYSVDYGPWSTYSGEPIIVQGGQTIVAKSKPLTSGESTDSTIASVTYEAAPAPIEVASLEVDTPLEPVVDSLIEPVFSGGGSKPSFGLGEFSLASVEESASLSVMEEESEPIVSPQSVTLSFADPGVEFGGIESQYFTNIEGSGAELGLNVSGTTLVSAMEDFSVTGNGDTAAFWLSGGMGDGSTTFSMDFSKNPASIVGFMLYHINVSGGGDKLTLSAVTDKGSILTNPKVDSVAEADFSVNGNVLDATGYNEDFSNANAGIEFTAPEGEKIVAVRIKWSESNSSTGGYHGVGMGEIRFTFTPDKPVVLTSISPELTP